jgi:CheY-like chemotaxis protein
VAHDFNNIITAILGSGAFLREDLVARGEATDEVDTVIAAAERASRLTRQLLAFSRATPADVTAVDVCRVVRDTESMLRRLMGEDITIDVLVTDVVMPRYSGPALVARLRAQRPGLRVLYVSGYVQDDAGLDLDAPYTAFLGKPYPPVALVNAVGALLDSGSG